MCSKIELSKVQSIDRFIRWNYYKRGPFNYMQQIISWEIVKFFHLSAGNTSALLSITSRIPQPDFINQILPYFFSKMLIFSHKLHLFNFIWRDNVESYLFLLHNFCHEKWQNISKNWKYIMSLSFGSSKSQCVSSTIPC